MTVSVVEVASSASTTSTTQTVTLATTPLPGDVIVLVSAQGGGGRAVATVSGCGATWVEAREDTTSQTISVWVGTDATTAGAITLTFTGSTPLAGDLIRALLVRGASAEYAADSTQGAGVATLAGPIQSVGPGQIVIAVGGTNTSTAGYFPAAGTTPTDWVVDTLTDTGGTVFNTIHRAPTETADHQAVINRTIASGAMRVTQIRLGTLDAGQSGSSAGAYGWAGSAAGHRDPAGVGSGAFWWSGAAAGSVPGGPSHGTAAGAFGWSGAAVGATLAPSLTADPWIVDLSGRTLLPLQATGSFGWIPPLEVAPAHIADRERTVVRRSVTVPALNTLAGAVVDPATGSVRIPDDVYDSLAASAVVEEVGVPHIIIGGRDVTYFRGGLTRLRSDRSEEPFGDVHAQIELPRVTSMDDEPDSPTHPLWWHINRANVQIVMKRADGSVEQLWGGHVVSHDTGNTETGVTKTLTCRGSLWQASTDVHRVPNMLEPTDIGTLIPKVLNGVTSRRYDAPTPVVTGIMSRQRGSWSDSPLAYVQGLLATAWTAGGNQWTVAKVPNTWRSYEMRLKKTVPSWTVTNGARGVEVSLTRDGASIRNVIYGHGVGPDGYAWWNYHYPNLQADDAPAYPFPSAGTVMVVGTTDAATASGDGVSAWQRRARDLGYTVTIDGVFNTADATVARTIQRRYGLSVDGVVGPQTWAATFDVGGNGGDLTGAVRIPLAADPRTQYWLYNADGSVAGKNPAWDHQHLIYADDIDFGSGVTRAEGVESAQQIVDREKDPALTGRIVLKSDPREGSRLLIPPGDKLTLIGFEGADRVLHITGVERDWENLTVTLDVDERSRDAMTLTQIRERNKEARRDPARRPGNVNRRSRLDVDQVVPFDGESGAGWIPRHAIFGGLWTVIRVPVSEVGRMAKVDVRTSGPASKFCLALFGAPIQPAHLARLVGNPLSGDNPFARTEAAATELDERFGFIEAFGGPGSAAGYWPKQESDGALTGKLIDTGGLEYVSAKPPWVWVAEWSPTSTFISGRLLPAPIQ